MKNFTNGEVTNYKYNEYNDNYLQIVRNYNYFNKYIISKQQVNFLIEKVFNPIVISKISLSFDIEELLQLYITVKNQSREYMEQKGELIIPELFTGVINVKIIKLFFNFMKIKQLNKGSIREMYNKLSEYQNPNIKYLILFSFSLYGIKILKDDFFIKQLRATNLSSMPQEILIVFRKVLISLFPIEVIEKVLFSNWNKKVFYSTLNLGNIFNDLYAKFSYSIVYFNIQSQTKSLYKQDNLLMSEFLFIMNQDIQYKEESFCYKYSTKLYEEILYLSTIKESFPILISLITKYPDYFLSKIHIIVDHLTNCMNFDDFSQFLLLSGVPFKFKTIINSVEEIIKKNKIQVNLKKLLLCYDLIVFYWNMKESYLSYYTITSHLIKLFQYLSKNDSKEMIYFLLEKMIDIFNNYPIDENEGIIKFMFCNYETNRLIDSDLNYAYGLYLIFGKIIRRPVIDFTTGYKKYISALLYLLDNKNFRGRRLIIKKQYFNVVIDKLKMYIQRNETFFTDEINKKILNYKPSNEIKMDLNFLIRFVH